MCVNPVRKRISAILKFVHPLFDNDRIFFSFSHNLLFKCFEISFSPKTEDTTQPLSSTKDTCLVRHFS